MNQERDKSHKEQIIRWARFVKENPTKCKKPLNSFLDAQIMMARRFYEKLSKTEEGRIKIALIKNL